MQLRRARSAVRVVLFPGLSPELAQALELRLPKASILRTDDLAVAMKELRRKPTAVVVARPGESGEVQRAIRRWRRSKFPLVVLDDRGADEQRNLLRDRPNTAIVAESDTDAVARAIDTFLSTPQRDAQAPPLSTTDLAAITQCVWEQIRETQLERLAVLEEAATALLHIPLDEELRKRAETAAHRLAGSLGCFGLGTGSKIAREVELLLMAPRPAPGQAFALSEKIVALGSELERHSEPVAPAEPASSRQEPLVLIVDRDEEETRRLIDAARAAEWRALIASDHDEAWRIIDEQHPAIVLLNLTMSGRVGDGIRFLGEIGARRNPTPVVIVSDAGTSIDRVDVARIGGRGFFQKPLIPAEIFHWIDSTIRSRPDQAQVLIITSSEEVEVTLHRILEPRGIRQHVITAFEETSWSDQSRLPEAVVIDEESAETARHIRSLTNWSAVPVLVLSRSEAHHDETASAFDDILRKPLDEQQVLARLVRPVEQARALRRLTQTDPITDTPNRPILEEAISRYLQMSERRGHPFTLALLDIDNFRQVNRDYGLKAGHLVLGKVSELLQTSFRREDVMGRWGDDEFAIGVYALTGQEVVDRISNILLLLREHTFRAEDGHDFCVTVSCGVAESPGDGRTLQVLYIAADRALQRARQEGRDRAAVAGLGGERALNLEAADIVLVEDDEALGSLLLQALHLKGYRTSWFKDGRQAVDALSGASRTTDARVILLDVDLPGLDGLSVLQRLARYGIQRRSRVIMLTVRTSEAEVLTAFKLGAFDHVGKPFSMPILLERIRRAMES